MPRQPTTIGVAQDAASFATSKLFHSAGIVSNEAWQRGLTTELSDSHSAVMTLAALDNRSASPKPATLELRSEATVRSSDLVRQQIVHIAILCL